jgi:hypothetical protein
MTYKYIQAFCPCQLQIEKSRYWNWYFTSQYQPKGPVLVEFNVFKNVLANFSYQYVKHVGYQCLSSLCPLIFCAISLK